MQFTGAAKVLGGEMMGLMRPKLANLAIAGAGAIATTKSAQSMNNQGVTVGNGLGAAAGTAAMAIGGYRAGIHRLATSSGQKALASKVIASAGRMQKAEKSLHPLAKAMGKTGRALNKSAASLVPREEKAARMAAMKAREASFDSRVGSLTSQQKGRSYDFLGLKTAFRKNKPLTVDQRRAAATHANATIRRQNQTPKSVNQAAYKAREAAAQAEVNAYNAGRERVADWHPRPTAKPMAVPKQIGGYVAPPVAKQAAGLGGGGVKGLISGFRDMGGFSMAGNPGGSARAMGNGNFSAY